MGNEENCLNLSPTLETPTPSEPPIPAEPSTPEPSDPSKMYSCWTEHLQKKIGSEYRAVFENGTEISNVPGLKKKEAMLKCDILGFRISNGGLQETVPSISLLNAYRALLCLILIKELKFVMQ